MPNAEAGCLQDGLCRHEAIQGTGGAARECDAWADFAEHCRKRPGQFESQQALLARGGGSGSSDYDTATGAGIDTVDAEDLIRAPAKKKPRRFDRRGSKGKRAEVSGSLLEDPTCLRRTTARCGVRVLQGSVIVIGELPAAGLSNVGSSTCRDAPLAGLRQTFNA
jgi:hypothetical protein